MSKILNIYILGGNDHKKVSFWPEKLWLFIFFFENVDCQVGENLRHHKDFDSMGYRAIVCFAIDTPPICIAIDVHAIAKFPKIFNMSLETSIIWLY